MSQIAVGIVLECRSPDGIFSINLLLGFRDERFDLDVENAYIDQEGDKKAVQYAIDHTEFFRDLIRNGEVEIFSAVDGKFLGRTGVFRETSIDRLLNLVLQPAAWIDTMTLGEADILPQPD